MECLLQEDGKGEGSTIRMFHWLPTDKPHGANYLQAKMAEYMGPERRTHLRMLDLLSLNQSVVRMKARKLVTMERMKM